MNKVSHCTRVSMIHTIPALNAISMKVIHQFDCLALIRGSDRVTSNLLSKTKFKKSTELTRIAVLSLAVVQTVSGHPQPWKRMSVAQLASRTQNYTGHAAGGCHK